MSKTVLSQVDGFTPVIDDVVKDVGLVAAMVFGVVWRYCQMADGHCRASQDTIAEKTGLSRKAVNENLNKLVKSDYLNIVKVAGMPNVYVDTGKAGLSLKVTGGVTESYRGCNPELQGGVTLGYTKKVIKKGIEETKKDSNMSAIAETVYEPFNNEADMPQSFVDEYKPKRVYKDARYGHVAYSAFYSVTNRKPNRAILDLLIEIVGDKPDMARLKECYTEWVARGYNTQAYNWLHWYREGIPERFAKKNEIKAWSPDRDKEWKDLIQR